MKCPKCGFVSYTGQDQCKKCSYPFVKTEAQASVAFLNSLFSGESSEKVPASAAIELDATRQDVRPELELLSANPPAAASKPEPSPPLPIFPPKTLPQDNRSNPNEGEANWREELSDRVVSFRKRRGKLPPESEGPGNLELEFEEAGNPVESHFMSKVEEPTETSDSSLDVEMGNHPKSFAEDDTLSSGHPSFQELDEDMQLDSAHEDADEMTFGEHSEKSPPMEIQVGSPAEYGSDEDASASTLFYAPLSRRLAAGFTDALILALGAALFAGIFWYSMIRFCDHPALAPFGFGILGLVELIVIFGYFSIFTALSSATPGLLWMGCEIRNMRGEHPTVSESLWRAFGVLVSLSALMLGFIWAYVDSESLTWHDRMSGTIVTEVNTATDLAGQTAQG